MKLFLVQHAEAKPKEEDPKRSLSEKGRNEIKKVAIFLEKQGIIKVNKIIHSGKTRAKQTADIMASFLKPENGVTQSDGLNPLDDVTNIVKDLTTDDNLMLVGHLPFMENLVSYLITGTIGKKVFKFQNGGIVCLDKDKEKGEWFIKWTLMPEIK